MRCVLSNAPAHPVLSNHRVTKSGIYVAALISFKLRLVIHEPLAPIERIIPRITASAGVSAVLINYLTQICSTVQNQDMRSARAVQQASGQGRLVQYLCKVCSKCG